MSTILKKWNDGDPATGTKNYMGVDCSEFYLAPICKTRDADILTESNWDCIMERLKPFIDPCPVNESGVEATPSVQGFNHWACGYYDLIFIHPSNTLAMAEAKKIALELKAYPVLDDDDFSQREWDATMELWDNLDDTEKAELCFRYECTLPDDKSFPQDDSGILFDYCRPE